jgi:uncharacterized protein YdaT
MPWNSRSAPKTVRGAKKRRQWAKIANAELRAGKREGAAKRIASSVMKRQRKKS